MPSEITNLISINEKPITIIFGRPGAGKSSIASRVYSLLNGEYEERKLSVCHYLDLDDYVPQWMKDNFSVGIYPSLNQRIEFAHEACKHVHETLQKSTIDLTDCKLQHHILISFSFVNQDLREIFRSKFPSALWILVDTPEEEAERRIACRQGHFYHGAPRKFNPKSKVQNNHDFSCSDEEWKFYPVTFPHIALNGMNPIEDNSKKVVATLLGRKQMLHMVNMS
jgi:gluconate kinase